MAVTKIIAIRDRLDKRVAYASNGEKTVLTQRTDYALNPEKTVSAAFVSVLNCRSVDTAADEMLATKRRWGKTGGVLGCQLGLVSGRAQIPFQPRELL